jgi:branched-subunit amino acid transport protein
MFLLIGGCCAATMLASRVVPVFALRSRPLTPGLARALGYIPIAAFAALVANDLFDPEGWAADPLRAALPLAAAALVAVVARKTRSLMWCAVVGVAAYALLLFVIPA